MDRTPVLLLVVVAVCSLTSVKGQATGLLSLRRSACRLLQCDAGLYCEFGHVYDGQGCPICECQLPGGSQTSVLQGPLCRPTCQIFCRFGNVIDAYGCPTCQCNPGPAAALRPRCPRGTSVVRPRMTCGGFNQCPVNSFCSSQRSGGQLGGLFGGRLGGQFGGLLGGRLGGQLGGLGGRLGGLGGRLGGQLGGRLGGQLGGLGGQLGGQLGGRLGGQLGGRLGGQFGGQLGGQFGGQFGGQGQFGGLGPFGGLAPFGGQGQFGGQRQGVCCRRRRFRVCRRVNWLQRCFRYWDQCQRDIDCMRGSRCCPGPCGHECQRRVGRVGLGVRPVLPVIRPVLPVPFGG